MVSNSSFFVGAEGTAADAPSTSCNDNSFWLDDEMKNIPFGAIAMYAYADKLACGLQQFMAGARKFKLNEIAREDLMSARKNLLL